MAGRGAVAEGARQQAALALSSMSGLSAGGAVAVRGGGVGGGTGGGGAVARGTAEEGVALGSGFVVDGGRGGLGLGVAGEERHVDGCCCVWLFVFVVVVVEGEGCSGAALACMSCLVVIDGDEVVENREAALEMVFLFLHEDSHDRLCTR